MNEKILFEKLKKLEEKYEASGQNLESYLDGLYESDFLNYWDYIHLDTLLSLQVKRTTLPDEEIFIIYHQVSELYFRLILVELEQICNAEIPENNFLENRLGRINRYFQIMIQSFRVMSEGLDAEQFMRFRMSLLPASGFQSVQYRYIEFLCTDIGQLVEQEHKQLLKSSEMKEKMKGLYWRYGSTDLKSGKKTLTLTRFEEKYDLPLLDFARRHETKNLRCRLVSNPDFKPSDAVVSLLRTLDYSANIGWRMAHLHSATRHLKKKEMVVEATGGTNWQRYLPPKIQKIIFFPELWSEAELENWGHPKESQD